jgi:hypothetical protein
MVIGGLVLVVLAVFAVSFFFSGKSSSPAPAAATVQPVISAPTSSTSSATSSSSAPASKVIPPQQPIPSGGVAPMTPAPGQVIDPASVALVDAPAGPPSPADLATPEGAVTAWMARYCPFNFADPFGAAETRARPAMTDQGWSKFDPTANDKARASWSETVAAKEIGRCAAPAAMVSPEAPRSAGSAIVIGSVNRVVSGAGGAPYVEQLAETRIVLRGTDGLWRVDTATVGG